MASRTSIYASIPYDALPGLKQDKFQRKGKAKTVDEVLDGFDGECDSGYDDDGRGRIARKGQGSGSSEEEEIDYPQSHRHEGGRTALLDDPSLYPDLDHLPLGASSSPPWTRWTSSRVTCFSTAYGITDDRVDCIWLVAGCEDGTLWVFCSTSGTSTHNVSLPVPGLPIPSLSKTSSSSAQDLSSYSMTPGRPNLSNLRRSSDTIGLRKAVGTAEGSSPKHNFASRIPSAAPSVMSSTRSAAGGRRHRHSHSNSISLAIHGSSHAGSPHAHGTHTPLAGRKASATVSVIDVEALGGDSNVSKKRPGVTTPTPPKSPPLPSPTLFSADRPSMSLEQLLSSTPASEWDKMAFEPVTHVYLDSAEHSPVAEVHLLPQEGNTTPFVCLTQSGRVFKCSSQDGTMLSTEQLTIRTFPRKARIVFGRSPLLGGPDGAVLLAMAKEGSCVVPILAKDLTILPVVQFDAGSLVAALTLRDTTYLLEYRQDSHLYITPLLLKQTPQDTIQSPQAHDAGLVDFSTTSQPQHHPKGVAVSGTDVVIWNTATVAIITLEDQKATVQRFIESRSSLLDVVIMSAKQLALVLQNSVSFVSMAGGDQNAGDQRTLLDFSLAESIESASALVPPTSASDALVLITREPGGSRNICIAPSQSRSSMDDYQSEADDGPEMHVAYQSDHSGQPELDPEPSSGARVSVALKHEDGLILGYTNGHLAHQPVSSRDDDGRSGAAIPTTETLLSGAIDSIHLHTSSGADGEEYIIAGTTAGSLAIFKAMSPYTEAARLELFNCPVAYIHTEDDLGLLVISADGALAVFGASRPLSDHPTIYAASRAPLEQIHYRSSQLLLVYEHGVARLWDMDEGKLQKTLDHQEAANVLAHMDGWKRIDIAEMVSTPLQALSLDLRTIIEDASKSSRLNPDAGSEDIDPSIRWLLGEYLIDIQEDYIRSACAEHLRINVKGENPEQGYIGSSSARTTSIFSQLSPFMSFEVSQKVTAQRLLAIVALCRVFLNYPETERYANEVIAYYATSLADLVGEGYKDASLDYLANFWLDESHELKQSARLLFGSRVGRLSDGEVLAEVEDRQARLLSETQSSSDWKSLLVLGELTIEKGKLLMPGTLRDIAYTISMSLDPTTSDITMCTTSLELLIRGWTHFQDQFDSVRVLRSVFKLATSSSSTPALTQLRILARQAILTIAAVNGPLFMTVLSLDAMNTDAHPDERAATMKLIAFMVRKKPVVLFASLPRLAEMTVRCLDPRSGLRGQLQQTATIILNELVKTYPSIAFHHKTQRLAVGTHEGACIVYDLKTATRLYVLESHKRRASIVSYSPDGRRLVTVSLEESNVKVWKVGSSLLGLLNVTGPPSQGHGGNNASEPYKTLDFILASPEEGMMTQAAQLEWLLVEWLEERRVKITIRETALTFSVV